MSLTLLVGENDDQFYIDMHYYWGHLILPASVLEFVIVILKEDAKLDCSDLFLNISGLFR